VRRIRSFFGLYYIEFAARVVSVTDHSRGGKKGGGNFWGGSEKTLIQDAEKIPRWGLVKGDIWG